MENSILEKIELANLWNEILSMPDNSLKSHAKSPIFYINLDNYVFRFESLLLNGNYNNDKLLKLISNCNQFIKNNSEMNDYLKIEREKAFKIDKSKLMAGDEFLELLDDVSITGKSNSKTNIIESNSLNQENQQKIIKNPEKLVDHLVVVNALPSITADMNIEESLNLFKKYLKEENTNALKDLIINISNKQNQDSVKHVCINLLNLENFKGDFKSNDNNITLKENELLIILNIIMDLNSKTKNSLSYTVSFSFLRYVLADYILFNLKQEPILSRKILQICLELCKLMPNPFIFSCLIIWIKEINEQTIKQDKNFIEFIVKIVKDCLEERESTTTLEYVLKEYSSSKWSEQVYSILSCLLENIPNINIENLNLLINKILLDSTHLSKSTTFSKLIMSILTKYKSHFTINNSEAIKSINASNSFHLIEKMDKILQNNQTLMKRALSNALNNLKA